ncbi:hypothetical protein MM213_08485 [Belliella sp. R4-6]|uniref:Tetratricopeptide repeat-containing protein n=1 Tax=Belliella alkalica TaxID=1730871 RepID=A0ABS9VAW0_9BACT|nr:hypothetical protein [Belliella alkalica]MCH7413518.1 hypothetical protein [Belliella alkalica]
MRNNMEELFEKYLNNKLSEGEKHDFENRLAEEPELKSELEFRYQIKIAVTLNERKRLKEILQKKSLEVRKPRFEIWKVAAAIVTLLSLTLTGYWLLNQNSQKSDFYVTYYETFPNLEMPSIRGGNTDNNLSEAYLAYENEEYQIAKNLLLADFEESGSLVSKFYAAMAALELNEYTVAYNLLDSIGDNIPSIYQNPRDYYLALLLLQKNKVERARVKLEKVANSEHILAGRAKQLLMEIS